MTKFGFWWEIQIRTQKLHLGILCQAICHHLALVFMLVMGNGVDFVLVMSDIYSWYLFGKTERAIYVLMAGKLIAAFRDVSVQIEELPMRFLLLCSKLLLLYSFKNGLKQTKRLQILILYTRISNFLHSVPSFSLPSRQPHLLLSPAMCPVYRFFLSFPGKLTQWIMAVSKQHAGLFPWAILCQLAYIRAFSFPRKKRRYHRVE